MSPLSAIRLSEMILLVAGILDERVLKLLWWACLEPDVTGPSEFDGSLLAPLRDNLMLLYTFNAGQRWRNESRWRGHEREIKCSNRKGGGGWKLVIGAVCFSLKYMDASISEVHPLVPSKPHPLPLHHTHWSLHIAQWQHWCIDGGQDYWSMQTQPHGHASTKTCTHTHMNYAYKIAKICLVPGEAVWGLAAANVYL